MLSRSAPASSITPTHRRTRVLETPPKPGSGRSLRIPRPSGLRIHRTPWSDDRAGHPSRCIRDPAAQEPTGIQRRPVLRSRGRRGDRSLWRHTLTTLGRENPPTGCRRACGRRQRNSIGFPTTAACGHGRRPRRHPLGQPLRASHPGAARSIGGPTATRPTGVAIASGHRDGRADQPAYKWRGMGPIAMRGCACTPDS